MIYAIQACLVYESAVWRGSKGVTTFFLDGDIQGIVDCAHAEKIAKAMFEFVPGVTAHVTASEATYLRSEQ